MSSAVLRSKLSPFSRIEHTKSLPYWCRLYDAPLSCEAPHQQHFGFVLGRIPTSLFLHVLPRCVCAACPVAVARASSTSREGPPPPS